jgi:hypothetical protein
MRRGVGSNGARRTPERSENRVPRVEREYRAKRFFRAQREPSPSGARRKCLSSEARIRSEATLPSGARNNFSERSEQQAECSEKNAFSEHSEKKSFRVRRAFLCGGRDGALSASKDARENNIAAGKNPEAVLGRPRRPSRRRHHLKPTKDSSGCVVTSDGTCFVA